MIEIIFETHATSEDNEAGLSSGWNDTELSKRGKEEAKKLGTRYKKDEFDAVFTSDLVRAYQTAILAFGENTNLIFADWRLRECNYGEFTQRPKEVMNSQRLKRIMTPFPGGESFKQTNTRMKSFLDDLKVRWDGKRVLIIGHRATHYGLECFIAGKTLEQCIEESLGWKWQPGWQYQLK